MGSKKAGGRWNSPGRAIVYASENRATAALEILVHVRRAQLLRDDYVIFQLDIPDDIVATLKPGVLAEGWDAAIETAASTDVGDAWFDTRASVALRVPSVAIRRETNLLLNPEHSDFGKVVIRPPERFLFDKRLEQ